MPSARIHEVIAKKINQEYGMNELLLRIGTVAPDCWRNVPESSNMHNKYVTHFWNFRIKEGQANDYEEFYFKYYQQLENPFYFGYFLHLIADQYWKTYIDPKYIMVQDGVKGYRLKDGSFREDKDWFGYYDSLKINKALAKNFHLDQLPMQQEEIPELSCHIDELDPSGLFGEKGTLHYINATLSYDGDDFESEIFDYQDIIQSIDETVTFIQQEILRLQKLKEVVDKSYKIAVDIDDTILNTEELKQQYWVQFLEEHPEIDGTKQYQWGDYEIELFWNQYREQMSFGKVKDGVAQALQIWKEKGYIVDLISARPIEKYVPLKKRLVEYLEQNGVSYRHMYLGFYSKIEFLKEHHYDLFIDNSSDHVEKARNSGIEAILFAPDDFGDHASDWHMVPDMVENIKKERSTRL